MTALFNVDLHAEEVIISSIPGVKVKLEDIAIVLFGRCHGMNRPHFEQLLDTLFCYTLLVLGRQHIVGSK